MYRMAAILCTIFGFVLTLGWYHLMAALDMSKFLERLDPVKRSSKVEAPSSCSCALSFVFFFFFFGFAFSKPPMGLADPLIDISLTLMPFGSASPWLCFEILLGSMFEPATVGKIKNH